MHKLKFIFLFLLISSSSWAQTKISQMPSGGNIQSGDLLPIVRGGANYGATAALGSSSVAGLLQCGTGLSCSGGVISGASFPSQTNYPYNYLYTDGTNVHWGNPADLIDPRSFAPAGTITCVGPGYTGGLSSSAQGIVILTAGTGGTTGTYTGVAITGGSGSGAIATVVVAGGVVTTVTITTAGSGYKLRDQISVASANIGNTVGFTAQVAHFSANQLPVYDGVHDDTPYFQAALNMAQNTGQAVLVPNGCWVTTLNIPQGVSMVGTGYSPTYGYDYDGGTASNMPVLYEENYATFVIHFGASPNNGFFGFEINDSATGAYQTAYCIGTDAASGGGTPHIWVRGMSFKSCYAGLGTPNNSSFFPISIGNDYGANVYGIYGYINDMQSIGDTFDTNSTAGILMHGGLQNIVGDRFEYNGQAINCNCSGLSVTASQFDENSNGAIEFIDGSGQNTIAGNTFQGNGATNTAGNDAAIIEDRNTSNISMYPPYMNISGNTFSAVGSAGTQDQKYVLDVVSTGADNDYIYINGGNALIGYATAFAIYRAGQPPHMKFSGILGVADYDTISAPFTATGCSLTSPLGGPTSGSIVSGTSGTCTVTVTPNGTASLAQPNGWTCGQFADLTTNADTSSWAQTGSTTTTATFAGTSVSGDTISFSCRPY